MYILHTHAHMHMYTRTPSEEKEAINLSVGNMERGGGRVLGERLEGEK